MPFDKKLDEFDLINRFIKPIKNENIRLGRGDDCSVVALSEHTYLIETTDCLVEDVHFRRRDFSFGELAYKTVLVNTSDIAAMGGTPLRAHLNLAVPKGVKEKDFADFFSTFYAVTESMGISLIGGDLSTSPGPVFVNLHIAGEAQASHIKWRQGLGKPGILAVSGTLGDSGAGFYCLENQINKAKLIETHKRPPNELLKGQWLGKQSTIQGMMDLSDGLFSDLQRITSGAIRIDLEKLPLSSALLEFCKERGEDPFRFALCGGEDYRLLVNCEKEQFADVASEFQEVLGSSLIPIGEVFESNEPRVEYFKENQIFESNWTFFHHF